MKLNKILAALLLASTLMLSGCGGNNSSSSKKPSGSGSQSQPAGDDDEEEDDWGDDEEEESNPKISYSELSVLKENGKIYVQLDGSLDDEMGITGNSMKVAFGLSDGSDFVVGSEDPADADFKYDVALASGEFSAKMELPSTGLVAGHYEVYFGPKDYYDRASSGSNVGDSVVNDDNFTYYFRGDNGVSGSTLILDAMPPVRIQEASVELNVPGHPGGIFAKIGGEKKGSLDQATLDGYDTFIDFQKLPNTTTSVSKYEAGDEAEENPGAYYFWKVEGTKAYIYIRINFMVAENATSGSYNTHLNVTENKQQNCRSEGDIDGTPVVVNAYGDTIAASSHPNGGHTEANIWANVGFVTEIQARPSADEDSSEAA